MIPVADLATIALMAVVTYATRLIGYLLMQGRILGARGSAMLDSAPGCVLIAVIAPYFVSTRPAGLAALAIAAAAAAARAPMLVTVIGAVAVDGALRHLLAR